MVCKLMKKGVAGAALTAGALYLAFGTSAPSYVKTAFHKVRHTAKDSVPLPFEIDRARDQIAELEPAIRDNRELLARAEEDVDTLKSEIAATSANLDSQKAEILALRQSLDTGEFRLTGSVSYTRDEVTEGLKSRLDGYNRCERTLQSKEMTLKSKEKAVIAARKQLLGMNDTKKVLAARVESIEARLKEIEATQTYNEFNFDDSALARAKQTVADLDKRLNVMARVAEMEGRSVDGAPVVIDPSRDVVKEVDVKFGPAAKAVELKGTEKSL